MLHQRTAPSNAGQPWLRRAGFTLLESVVGTALCALAISAFYVSTNHAVRLARAGRETALAGEVLEQRLSAVRGAPLWTSVISTTGMAQIFAVPSPAAATFPAASETLTVTPYPADGTWFSVTRDAAGSVNTAGASLDAETRCVQVTLQLSWTGPNRVAATRRMATILTKGGL